MPPWASGQPMRRRSLPCGQRNSWYIDFIRPCRRTPDGIDTLDLLVDLVVTPDLSACRWKDEDEYAQGRRLGVITDALHRGVEAARQHVISLVESRQGPFAEGWSSWRPDPSWPLPALPRAHPAGTGHQGFADPGLLDLPGSG